MIVKRASQIAEKINPALFRAFMIIGFLTGIFIASLSASAASSQPTSKPQQNFLIALVENAQDENSPVLAIWLAATYLEVGEVSWMPIYPQPLGQGKDLFAESHDPILISPQNLDVWLSHDLLRDQGMWWDEIIVLDRIALATLTNIIPSDNSSHSASTWTEPQTALYQQVQLIQQFCEQSAVFNNPSVLDQFLLLISNPSKLHTTLSSFEFITLWDKLASRQFELSCNHPWAD